MPKPGSREDIARNDLELSTETKAELANIKIEYALMRYELLLQMGGVWNVQVLETGQRK